MANENLHPIFARILSDFRYLSSIGKMSETAFRVSKAEKNDIDAWLVANKHPLAYEPGTQNDRIMAIAKELDKETTSPKE